MPVRNADTFLKYVQGLSEHIGTAHAKAQGHLVAAAFADVVESSPVRTGEYRASHVVGTGGERLEEFLYEHPERPEAEAPAASREVPLPPPDVGSAAAAVANLTPYENVIVGNDKFYGPFLEFGTARMEPRLIYDRAARNTEGRLADAQAIFDGALRSVGR